MSSKNNVNPDHYKIAGRERQGEDIIHDVYKRRYTQSKSNTGAGRRNFIPGSLEEEIISEVERKADEAVRRESGKARDAE
ncbi:MAG: hypothetical protein JMDDDDMK_01994 [Acidobacteria bacterium]|nr:hypothetical protein [Acidobacteriota bacterium]